MRHSIRNIPYLAVFLSIFYVFIVSGIKKREFLFRIGQHICFLYRRASIIILNAGLYGVPPMLYLNISILKHSQIFLEQPHCRQTAAVESVLPVRVLVQFTHLFYIVIFNQLHFGPGWPISHSFILTRIPDQIEVFSLNWSIRNMVRSSTRSKSPLL